MINVIVYPIYVDATYRITQAYWLYWSNGETNNEKKNLNHWMNYFNKIKEILFWKS